MTHKIISDVIVYSFKAFNLQTSGEEAAGLGGDALKIREIGRPNSRAIASRWPQKFWIARGNKLVSGLSPVAPVAMLEYF